MNRAELKKEAKKNLSGNWQWAVLLTLVTFIICGLAGALIRWVDSFLAAMLMVGYAYTFLDLNHGILEKNYFTAMFSGFTHNRFVPVFLNWLLSTLFITLWTLLLIIPGIIKALAYSQSYYIIKDMLESGQEVQPIEAITKSRQLMDGHKWEFFVLELSFIGWGILSCITLGIGFLWLKPYMQMTNVKYYRQLAGDQFKGGQAAHNDPEELATPTASETDQPVEPNDKAEQLDELKQDEPNAEPTHPEQPKNED